MKWFKRIADRFPKDWPTRIGLILLVVLALVGAFYVYGLTRQLVATNETFSIPGDPVIQEENSAENSEGTPAPTEIPAADLPTPEPWDGVSRVNVLVMGLDYRDWEAGEVPRTDTMLLFTLNPVKKTAGMISIPRDLWVSIPGFEHGKINTAYYLGEVNNLPGGGAGLAAQTVEELLGVPIHYYAQIDFQAFVDFIDHIKGVRLTFDEPMKIDLRGDDDPLTIEPGVVTLPGEYALAFVRSRSTEGGDFDRARRQQILIMAVRDRILEFDMMPNLVAKAPEIYSDLAAGINTNMNLSQAIKLGWSVLDIDRDQINQVIISNEYVTLGKSPDGLDILKPIPDKIRLLRDEVFGAGAALGPVADGELLDLAAEEGARISVRNGSSQPGLAAKTAAWFREQGLNVVEEAEVEYAVYSQIHVYDGTPYALRWLSDTMSLTEASIYDNYDPNAQFDLIVVLGDDWLTNNPIP
ncbi:MAG: LCP family protein [Chloroflexota bacterium]|jgi:LCP family protein required for cell wall assembly|nr:LCP family protein [Chloroflexota bacterium]